MLAQNSKKRSSFFSLSFGLFFVYWIHSQTLLVMAATIQDLGILDELLKAGYDRRATPTNHLNNSTPTIVNCELFVRSFGSPNPMTMDYKVDLYLRQKWTDDRLKHDALKDPLDLNDPNLVKAIWKPEVYFPNSKDADFQFVTVPNVLIRIHPGGEILYMLRLKMTFSCMMDLSKFPLDKQNCTIEVASFSKTVEELILVWKTDGKPVSTTGSLGMSQFELVQIVTDKCTESFQIGNYSCLVAEFHLSRSLGFHLVQSYLPTILMVVISWVSFWMDVNSVPGRVTLGVTTLLTVSSKATNIQENLVQTSYIKAIDLWMSTCTAFVFLALLEFTIVNYLWRKECISRSNQNKRIKKAGIYAENDLGLDHHKRDDDKNVIHEMKIFPQSDSGCATIDKRDDDNLGMDAMPMEYESEIQSVHRIMNSKEKIDSRTEHQVFSNTMEFMGGGSIPEELFRRRATKIDERARVLFPLAFLLFNLFYWPYYSL